MTTRPPTPAPLPAPARLARLALALPAALAPPAAAQDGPPPGLLENEWRTVRLIEENVRSVVLVEVSAMVPDHNFGHIATRGVVGYGSGFLWDDQGHIVTNEHIADDGDLFFIKVHGDDTRHEARLVGQDVRHDIAVLKFTDGPPPGAEPAALGSSADLRMGQSALAFGFPQDSASSSARLSPSFSSGVISATDVPQGNVGMVQMDTPVSTGSSGGPLLNSAGEVVGVVRHGNLAGVNFSVPIDPVKKVVSHIIRHQGRPVTLVPGVVLMEDYHDDFFRFYRLERGIVIKSVVENHPLQMAGFEGLRRAPNGYRIGGVVLSVNGTPVDDYDDVVAARGRSRNGVMEFEVGQGSGRGEPVLFWIPIDEEPGPAGGPR